jgi:hypothetical protein
MATREESQMAMISTRLAAINCTPTRADQLTQNDHIIVHDRIGVVIEDTGSPNMYGQTVIRFKVSNDDIDPWVHIVPGDTLYRVVAVS